MKRLLVIVLCSLGLTVAHAQSGIDQYLLCGAHVTAVATPDEGYRFVSWSDGNTDNPRFITMTGEVNLTAQFVVKITTNVSGANVSAAPAHKILRDGQVYIERNGKIYTVTGAEVR